MEQLTFNPGPVAQEDDSQYLPLPHYPWDARPLALPLDEEECRTALHLSSGSLTRAAVILKVPEVRLMRAVRRNARLTALYSDLLDVIPYKSADVIIHALHDPSSDQRQLEWAAARGLASRAAARLAHPLSPAPPAPAQSATIASDGGPITIHWGNPPDSDPLPDLIHGPSSSDG